MSKTCEKCGSELPERPPSTRGPKPRYCGQRCREQARAKKIRAPKPRKPPIDYVCRYCEESFQSSHPNRKHCGEADCKKAYNRERMREFGTRKAEELGESYYKKFRAGAYQKAKAHPDGPPRRRWPAKFRAGDQLRRARKAGATVESFRSEEIYERDGWVCQLCDGRVDRSLAWPEPMSASLDHIVPLSKGGAHSRANVQCSHLDCNVRKGAR